MVKTNWSRVMDKKLVELVKSSEKEGQRIKWSKIAKTMGIEKGKVKRRFQCHLCPMFDNHELSPYEKSAVIRLKGSGLSDDEIRRMFFRTPAVIGKILKTDRRTNWSYRRKKTLELLPSGESLFQ
jgi:hypothetical protein